MNGYFLPAHARDFVLAVSGHYLPCQGPPAMWSQARGRPGITRMRRCLRLRRRGRDEPAPAGASQAAARRRNEAEPAALSQPRCRQSPARPGRQPAYPRHRPRSGRCGSGAAHRAARCDQRRDLAAAIGAGRDPVLARRDQPGGRNGRIGGAEPGGDREPAGGPGRAARDAYDVPRRAIRTISVTGRRCPARHTHRPGPDRQTAAPPW